jgi:catechol 2,3-dioxygenase-like lactoylglutathione lyase family enzyme
MASVLRVQHVSIPIPAGGVEPGRAFYGETIGLEQIPTPPALEESLIAWFALGDTGDELHLLTEEEDVRSAGQHFCLQVDDIEAWRQKLGEAGVEVAETEPIASRPRFMIRDPFGNRIELTQITGDNYTDDPGDETGKEA